MKGVATMKKRNKNDTNGENIFTKERKKNSLGKEIQKILKLKMTSSKKEKINTLLIKGNCYL
jgi:hypothetical protein